MDSKLREAVQIVRRGKKQVTWDAESAKEYNDALALVLDLAESVLAMDRDKLEIIILDVQESLEKENSHIVLLQSHRRKIADAILSAMKGGGE